MYKPHTIVDRAGPSLTSKKEVFFLYKLKMTACYFIGFAIASLLCWMMCGQGLQYDVDIISSV